MGNTAADRIFIIKKIYGDFALFREIAVLLLSIVWLYRREGQAPPRVYSLSRRILNAEV